jgi:hypothetical protein
MDGNGRCSVSFDIPLCRETPAASKTVNEERTVDPAKSLSHPSGIT